MIPFHYRSNRGMNITISEVVVVMSIRQLNAVTLNMHLLDVLNSIRIYLWIIASFICLFDRSFLLFGLNSPHIILFLFLFLHHTYWDKSRSSAYPSVCMCKTADSSIACLSLLMLSYVSIDNLHHSFTTKYNF